MTGKRQRFDDQGKTPRKRTELDRQVMAFCPLVDETNVFEKDRALLLKRRSTLVKRIRKLVAKESTLARKAFVCYYKIQLDTIDSCLESTRINSHTLPKPNDNQKEIVSLE